MKITPPRMRSTYKKKSNTSQICRDRIDTYTQYKSWAISLLPLALTDFHKIWNFGETTHTDLRAEKEIGDRI